MKRKVIAIELNGVIRNIVDKIIEIYENGVIENDCLIAKI